MVEGGRFLCLIPEGYGVTTDLFRTPGSVTAAGSGSAGSAGGAGRGGRMAMVKTAENAAAPSTSAMAAHARPWAISAPPERAHHAGPTDHQRRGTVRRREQHEGRGGRGERGDE